MARTKLKPLEKYVGKYCVRAELDPDTNDFPRDTRGQIPESYDDLYIPCTRGVIKSSAETGLLALYIFERPSVAERVKSDMKNNNIWYREESAGNDALLMFKEQDIEKVAKIVVPKTRGKNIKPFSNAAKPSDKNKDVIPKEELSKYNELLAKVELPQIEKIHYFRHLLTQFDDIIKQYKGDDYDITKQRKESGLRPKEFIYFIGLWDVYLDFVQGEMNKR